MAKDFKDFITGLLFEDSDEGEVVEQGELQDVYEEPVKPVKKVVAPVKTEAALKPVEKVVSEAPKKKSSFNILDVEEPVLTPGSQMVHVGKSFEAKKNEEYEFQSTISPIFGVLGNDEKVVVREVKVEEKLVKKPESSHLGTVLSPIYGYGSREDDSNAMKAEAETSIEKELHDIFKERDESFKEVSIDEILNNPIDDETVLAEQEISLFDQIFSSEDK